MPYIDGKRVSNEEWTERFGSIQRLHTGPDGDNPASAPDIDEEVGAPKPKPKSAKKAGSQRSPKSAKATKAAIADALGVKDDSSQLDDIDVSGLDAPATEDDGNDAD
jgi:hypothetical protein